MNSNAYFKLDNRTIQNKLQYLYEYSSQIPFREVGPAEIAFTDVSDEYSALYKKERATDGVKSTWWHSKNSTDILPFIEFTLTKPSLLKSLEITRKPSQSIHIHGTVIQLKDVHGKVVWTETIILSPATADHQIRDGVPAAPESFRFEIPNHLPSVKTVRLERGPRATEDEMTGNYLALSEIKIEKYNSWCDVLFKNLSVSELADKYQKPTGSLPPHQALLFAFLKMLETTQALMNGLPARQRDLYYQGLLGLRPREAKPGKVAVSMQLEEEASNIMIPKGSLLKAGQDENGIDIEYQLDHDVLANQSSFSALCLSDQSSFIPSTDKVECIYDAEDDKKNWPQNGIALNRLNLYLGFKNLNKGDTLSLFFNLIAIQKLPIKWFFYDENNKVSVWQPLESTLIDNTSNLSESGTWSTVWPIPSSVNDLAWIKGQFTESNIEASECYNKSGEYHPWHHAGNGDTEETYWHSLDSDDACIEFKLTSLTDIKDMYVYSRAGRDVRARYLNGVNLRLFDQDGSELFNHTIEDEGIFEPTNKLYIPLGNTIKNVATIRLDNNARNNITDDKYIVVSAVEVNGEILRHDLGITLNGIVTNAATATVANAGQLTDFVNQQPLPPESITALATDIQGVSEIVQPWQSWGSKAPEALSEFNIRASRNLMHRERAVSFTDMISIIKDNFNYVFDVIPKSNEAPEKISLVVVPRADSDQIGTVYEPKLGEKKLKELCCYLTNRASAWIDVEVLNPTYKQVNLNCTVTFKSDVNLEYGTAQLIESLIQHYMPWVEARELGPKVANEFNDYDFIAYIQQHPLVDSLTTLSLSLDSDNRSIPANDTQVLVLSPEKIIITAKHKG